MGDAENFTHHHEEFEAMRESRDLWRRIAAGLAGVVLTLCGVWFTYIRDAATMAWVTSYVTNYSPYARAEAGITAEQRSQNERLSGLDDRVYMLQRNVDQLMAKANLK